MTQKEVNTLRQDFIAFSKSKNIPEKEIQKIIGPANYVSPMIIEERPMNIAALDVFSRLMMDRIIYFTGEVETESCKTITAQLLYLDSIEHKDISIYINSPGGEVYSGFGLIDTMNFIKSNVSTTCIGMAASMAANILACGTKGLRSATKHSRVMIHQVITSSGYVQASDFEIENNELQKTKKQLIELLVDATGKPYKIIEKDEDRNFWMTAEDAKKYGIIDKVIETTNVKKPISK